MKADGKEGDEDRLVADSRKRVSAALFEGSGCLEQTLVAKRMRSATDTTEAKEPRSFCDIAEEQSSHTGPAANQEVDGRAGSNATSIQSNFSFWIYFVVQLAWLQRFEQWVESPWESTT